MFIVVSTSHCQLVLMQAVCVLCKPISVIRV